MVKQYDLIVNDVSKSFNNRRESSLGTLLSIFKKKKEKNENNEVLKNISFKLEKRKILGLIGRNGSGKTTLLKILSGIYTKDSGNVFINGEIIYLTSFGRGLHEKLSMRDNIFMVGSLMGLKKNELKKKFEEIVEFSGLQNFLDKKIKDFSSGMLTRLGFSIGVHCIKYKSPNVLLLDEVGLGSGGGDIDFYEKTKNKLKELINSDMTIIMVSHKLDNLSNYCDEIIWLEKGKIKQKGEPKKIIDQYKKSKPEKIVH